MVVQATSKTRKGSRKRKLGWDPRLHKFHILLRMDVLNELLARGKKKLGMQIILHNLRSVYLFHFNYT